jgi:hypothetical protein
MKNVPENICEIATAYLEIVFIIDLLIIDAINT